MTVIALQTSRVGVSGILAMGFMGKVGILIDALRGCWRDRATAALFLAPLWFLHDGRSHSLGNNEQSGNSDEHRRDCVSSSEVLYKRQSRSHCIGVHY